MHLFHNKLYRILSIACLAGYIWLYFNLSTFYSKTTSQIGVCLFKRITSIPCPACGTTRSVLSIIQGNLLEAFYWNPFGFLLLTVLIITPIWVVIDAINKKDSLLIFYVAVEKKLQQKLVVIPAIALILINWFWNIHKGV